MRRSGNFAVHRVSDAPLGESRDRSLPAALKRRGVRREAALCYPLCSINELLRARKFVAAPSLGQRSWSGQRRSGQHPVNFLQ